MNHLIIIMNLPTLIALKQDQIKKYLPLAVELSLHKQIANSEGLNKQQKVIITKIYKNLNTICKLNVKELKELIKNQPHYQQALGDLYFDKKINNYFLITNYQKNAEISESAILQISNFQNTSLVIGIEYKIQFTISNIAKKKVMKPVILLVFLLKNGSKLSLYYSVQQFALLRAKVANAMRQIYGVELRTL